MRFLRASIALLLLTTAIYCGMSWLKLRKVFPPWEDSYGERVTIADWVHYLSTGEVRWVTSTTEPEPPPPPVEETPPPENTIPGLDYPPTAAQLQYPSGTATFTASTTEELLQHLGPNRVILLDADEFQLAAEAQKPFGEYHSWTIHSDQSDAAPQNTSLVIRNLQNLRIQPAPGRSQVALLASPRDGWTLTLINCQKVQLVGLVIGHNDTQSGCSGGILRAGANSSDISIANCTLFGRGMAGLGLTGARNVSLANSTIRDCADSIAHITGCTEITVRQCRFLDNGGGIVIASSHDMRVEDSSFEGNQLQKGAAIEADDSSAAIQVTRCRNVSHQTHPFTSANISSIGNTELPPPPERIPMSVVPPMNYR